MNKNFCPNCGAELSRDDVFCGSCGTRIGESVISPVELWHQDFYRIRGEGSTGRIENRDGKIVGFYKSNLFGRMNVKIYSGEDMGEELFYVVLRRRIIQIIDSHTNTHLGYIKGKVFGRMLDIYNTYQQPIGKLSISARAGKYVLELEGRPVAEGDKKSFFKKSQILEINSLNIPDNFDPRILLSFVMVAFTYNSRARIYGLLLLALVGLQVSLAVLAAVIPSTV